MVLLLSRICSIWWCLSQCLPRVDFLSRCSLDLKFRFEEFIEIDPTREFQRPLLTTTTTDQRDEGFTLLAEKSEDEFALYFQIGEGSELLPPFPSRGRVTLRGCPVSQPYEWHAISLIFRLFDPVRRGLILLLMEAPRV